jgi:hypothetical protein
LTCRNTYSPSPRHWDPTLKPSTSKSLNIAINRAALNALHVPIENKHLLQRFLLQERHFAWPDDEMKRRVLTSRKRKASSNLRTATSDEAKAMSAELIVKTDKTYFACLLSFNVCLSLLN